MASLRQSSTLTVEVVEANETDEADEKGEGSRAGLCVCVCTCVRVCVHSMGSINSCRFIYTYTFSASCMKASAASSDLILKPSEYLNA